MGTFHNSKNHENNSLCFYKCFGELGYHKGRPERKVVLPLGDVALAGGGIYTASGATRMIFI